MKKEIKNVEVFNDTKKMIKDDEYLSAAVEQSKKKTTIHYGNDYPQIIIKENPDMELTVTHDRSFQAAMRLKRENSGQKVAVMNFANAFQPGGGVTIGANAQEECLCRCSTLYPVLDRKYLKDDFYGFHKKIGDSRATDAIVYSEDIVVFKTDESVPQRMPKEDWVKVDVITVAAPDLRKISMSDAELFGYHVRRAMHVLTVAAYHDVDTLVLGAFGCGAFANNPQVVARAYKAAFAEFPKVFKKIEFAIYCPDEEQVNYNTFKNVLTEK